MALIPYKNEVRLCGNVGNDPEIRYLPSGDAVMSIRLATVDRWKDGKDEWQEHTEWHTVVLYRKTAERAKGYKKGDTIYVEGRKFTRVWKDHSQVERKSTEIIGESHHRVEIERDNYDKTTPITADRGEDVPPVSTDGPKSLARLA